MFHEEWNNVTIAALLPKKIVNFLTVFIILNTFTSLWYTFPIFGIKFISRNGGKLPHLHGFPHAFLTRICISWSITALCSVMHDNMQLSFVKPEALMNVKVKVTDDLFLYAMLFEIHTTSWNIGYWCLPERFSSDQQLIVIALNTPYNAWWNVCHCYISGCV